MWTRTCHHSGGDIARPVQVETRHRGSPIREARESWANLRSGELIGRRPRKSRSREACTEPRALESAVMPLVALVIVALGAVIGAIAPLYLRLVRRELSRADRMERAARTLGLRFSLGDPAYPGSIGFEFPFELFSRGIEQTCENVMSGTIDGVAVVALDFLYVQQVDTSGPRPDASPDYRAFRSEPVRYACAVAAIGGPLPHFASRTAPPRPHITASPCTVGLEGGGFHARYRVWSPERGLPAAPP